MQKLSGDEYLAHEVHTAPPQKLQLLMIEGAIRQLQWAKKFWTQADPEQAGKSIVRAQEIISYLLAGLKTENKQPLIRKIASIYLYLVRSLSTAQLQRNLSALDDALRVLEIERETWQLVCDRLAGSPNRQAATGPHFAPSPRPTSLDDHSSGMSWHA